MNSSLEQINPLDNVSKKTIQNNSQSSQLITETTHDVTISFLLRSWDLYDIADYFIGKLYLIIIFNGIYIYFLPSSLL